ncbi:MAG: hypothetical protein HKL85_06535 [Acidimicrobiaceae bacterium]|nr:hypothetical protein [Acidimicrobiaceae bacterium]
MRKSGLPLVATVVVGIALAGVISAKDSVSNPVPNPGVTGPSAQSSALYCTGLTNAKGDLRGIVTFINTTSAKRQVVVHAVATNAAAAVATAFTLGPYARQVVTPTNLLVGGTYALAAQIDGGGVSAEQVVTRYGTQAPCVNEGVTTWYASGFDTTVGSAAILSIYNPTATAAVFNVTTFSPGGFLSPAPLQGVSVGPHAVLTLDLGSAIVATQNFGVQVNVLRGSLVIVGDQISRDTSSLNYGTSLLATSGTFPLVTTAKGSVAQVRIANPGPAPAKVTFTVKIKKFVVAPQSVAVAPYSSAMVSVTPNTAIPAAGEASLTMTSTQPVDATLATGTKNGLTLSPMGVAMSRAVLSDVTGGGFAQATVTNTSNAPTTVTWALLHHGSINSTGLTPLGAGQTVSLGQALGGRAKLQGATLVLTSATPVLAVNAILTTFPYGVTMAASLNGG